MFNLGKDDILGIDFGASAIKAVEISVSEKNILLKKFGEVSLRSIENGLPSGAETTYDEQLQLLFSALVQKMKLESAEVFVTLPSHIGLISFATFPYLENEELASAVQFEAKKYIPSDLDDVILNWDVFSSLPPSDENPGGVTRVVLSAVLKSEVERFKGYIESAGLAVRFMEIEIFSLARALSLGAKEGTKLIIDIGSKVTNLVVMTNGVVQANSTVSIGGNDITHTIADAMNISPERADELKKSGNNFVNAPQSNIIFPALETIVAETQRLLKTFHEKNSGQICEEVVLSGGGSRLAGVSSFFQTKLEMPVSFGTPFENIDIPQSVPRDDYLDTEYVVALGAALSYKEALERDKQKKVSTKKNFFSMLNKKI